MGYWSWSHYLAWLFSLFSALHHFSIFIEEFLACGYGELDQFPQLEFEQLPFNHPLFIMYSSGTTGAPKCMVHSAGVRATNINIVLREELYLKHYLWATKEAHFGGLFYIPTQNSIDVCPSWRKRCNLMLQHSPQGGDRAPSDFLWAPLSVASPTTHILNHIWVSENVS